MNKVPHITIEQAQILFSNIDCMLKLGNELIDKANAKLDTQDQYITVDEARALVESGQGAEWYDNYEKSWSICNKFTLEPGYKYRAIRKEEPHAELQALYEQQVIDGTLKDFVWEFFYLKTKKWLVIPVSEQPLFINPVQYRCTPKPTCQILNTDTGKLKTMTREAAINLQYETKDTHDWLTPKKSNYGSEALEFNDSGIYTFRLKTKKQVSLDPAIREGVIALLQELGLAK